MSFVYSKLKIEEKKNPFLILDLFKSIHKEII